MNDILNARESRYRLLNQLDCLYPVVIVHANIPGNNKNLRIAYFLVDYFKKLLEDKYQIVNQSYHESDDGPFWLLEVKAKYLELKKGLIKIEDTDLGRLIDLDVYFQNSKSLSRKDLKIGFRKCLICFNDAHLCIREKRHAVNEVLEKIEMMILDFLQKELFVIVDEAITLEAQLEPKFGLVTVNSSGSHPDMNYQMLMDSKKAIIDDLMLMFKEGYLADLDTAFTNARLIGKNAEAKMYQVTNNINTYKGLIFVLGIVLVALGRMFKEFRFDLFDSVKFIGRNLVFDFQGKPKTFGEEAYHKYQMLGIRGEVMTGLINVKTVKDRLQSFSQAELIMVLIRLIEKVEDTVLLKRAKSFDKYFYYREKIANIKEFDLEKIEALTTECINENLSFGGSADLLVVAILVRKIEEKFKYHYE